MSTARGKSIRQLLLGYELAFLILVLVTGAIGGAWAYFWQQTAAESVRLNDLAHTAEALRTTLFQQMKDVALARMRDDPAAQAVYARYYRTIQEGFNSLRQRSATRAEDYAVQHMQESYGRLQADMQAVFADPYLLNRFVRLKILDPRYEEELVGGFEEAFRHFRGLIEQSLAEQAARIGRWTRYAPYVLPLPLLVALGLLFLSRASLRRGVVKPMVEVIERTRRMSDGDLEQRLPVHGVAEVAQLASSVNQLAADLAASRDALIASEREAALGALVPVVAHNVRNPLAAIRASAQMLEHAESLAEAQEVARGIMGTVDRLRRWISALVSYLHPFTPQRVPLPACRLLSAVADLIAPRAADKGIALQREPWDTAAIVDVDPDLMEQALYGLVSNAIDASPQDGVVALGVARTTQGIVLTILDHGPGIPFIPEPSGLQPGPTTKRYGTGLGIPVASKVCKAHGWILRFEVAENGGTRIRITAPASKRPSDVDEI